MREPTGGETARVPEVVLAHVDELQPLVGHQVRINGWDYAVWLLPTGDVGPYAYHVISGFVLAAYNA